MSELSKIMEARIKRSTGLMYDAAYWEEWKRRFKTTHDPNDPQVKVECEKKEAHLKRNLHMMGGSLLDIGSATGLFVNHMSSRGWNACGVDVLPDGRELAPERIRQNLFVGSVTELPFPDLHFDVLTAYDVMEHLYIEQIFQAVQEIERVAKRAFIMRMPIDGWRGEGGIPDLAVISNDPGHVGIYTWEFWVRRFTENGFFRLHNVEIWDCQSAPGWYMECWMILVKK